MANFEILGKGPPLAVWPKLAILSTVLKSCHYSANCCCLIEIVVSIETRIKGSLLCTLAKIDHFEYPLEKLPLLSQLLLFHRDCGINRN